MKMASNDADLQHFLAIPWCAKTLSSSQWLTHTVQSRTAKADTEDELFGRTLRSPRTITHMLYAHPVPLPGASIPVLHGYATLAAGLNGFAGVCHGGIVATVIDEFQGMSLTAWRGRERELAVQRGEVAADAPLVPSMTGELTVRYVRPVRTPQTVLVVTKVREVRGRKLWMDSEMVDSEGMVLATGKSLFIQMARASNAPATKL